VLDNLKWDIFTAAHDAGTTLMSNGSVNNVKTSRKIRCGSAHRHVRETTSTSTKNFDTLRKVSLVNDAKIPENLGEVHQIHQGKLHQRITETHANLDLL
jgi:hypothetical protein